MCETIEPLLNNVLLARCGYEIDGKRNQYTRAQLDDPVIVQQNTRAAKFFRLIVAIVWLGLSLHAAEVISVC